MESTSKVSLKILIDRRRERVLFAEAGKDFVDFLFQIFSLPLGSVVSLLSKEHMVGCLGKLYSSIENLNNSYMQPCASKNDLLNPKTPSRSVAPLLLPSNSASPMTKRLYRCQHTYSSACYSYVADDPHMVCPSCRNRLSVELTYLQTANGQASTQTNEGGYVKGLVRYTVMDDLEVKPMSTISSITLLNKFDVKDLGALEEKNVYFGMDEGLKLLKASLQSNTVLTDVFLGNKLTIK